MDRSASLKGEERTDLVAGAVSFDSAIPLTVVDIIARPKNLATTDTINRSNVGPRCKLPAIFMAASDYVFVTRRRPREAALGSLSSDMNLGLDTILDAAGLARRITGFARCN
jgi:hypothetical protein